MMVSQMDRKLTSVCWDKCITGTQGRTYVKFCSGFATAGTPGSKFSSVETTCPNNCAHRFLGMSMMIAKRFLQMQ
uniref:Mitochondrial import inner membrane translocase subunit n=1 Tax=Oryza rufipogon TaxID=4529 RepID=A0A0E0RFY2_ORYRU